VNQFAQAVRQLGCAHMGFEAIVPSLVHGPLTDASPRARGKSCIHGQVHACTLNPFEDEDRP
jgi:hypothetical protein